ncbi:hypothetical protein RD110_00025 [Rhodoferax koreense]|uniref:DUF4124 domain-containing protein n=1 Tax=Rhodoferax koreensis TaxID=1842727 RepID=A0A1P8JPX1_9BURK|nr:hypothetical protein RD110_00025 [Rhodoferax koreense]
MLIDFVKEGSMAVADDEERRAPSPFSPAPEKRRWPAFLLALLLLLALVAWVWHEPAGLGVTVRGLAHSVATPDTAPVPDADAPPASPTPPATATRLAPAPGQTVSKCVLKGRTTYSDGPCPDGAKAEQLAVRPDVNLMQASVLAQATPIRSALPPPAPAPVVIPAPPPDADKAATCSGLARYIEDLDAWARQPQSGEMQDWITARKREARDRQFRLKC